MSIETPVQPAPPTPTDWASVNIIKAFRKGRGWTQAELAERVGATAKQLVCWWETGRCMPSPANLEPLAKLMGRSGEEIYTALMLFKPKPKPRKRK